MSFSATITITGSTNITNFDIYQCPTSGCTNCAPITGSTGQNVSRMKLLTGHTVTVDQGYRYIKLVADTETCNNSICMEVIGIPTFTPTATPINTSTPTPTATNTPVPTVTTAPPTVTPTPTATNTPTPTATNTPTPTATNTPTPTVETGCVEFELLGGTLGRTFTFMDCNGMNQEITIPQGDSAPYCIALPYLAVGATRGESCVATIPCYLYEITGNDGTSNKGSFDFSYTNCDGTVINGNVVNTRTITVCARVDSVTSTSNFVDISIDLGTCTENPPTPTPLPEGTEVFSFYRADEVLFSSYGTTYCSQEGYNISGPVYSLTAFADLSPNSSVIYTDNLLTEPLVGNGTSYRFAIASEPNTGTEDGLFTWVSVDSNGLIINKGTYTCAGGGEEDTQ